MLKSLNLGHAEISVKKMLRLKTQIFKYSSKKDFDYRIYNKNVPYIAYFVMSKSHVHRVLNF
jgi:hypothetical protein